MPALQPPSMQIGALPNGAATVSPLPVGPSLGYGFNEALPSLVQQHTAASSAAAPASFTNSGITATTAGTYLVFLVAAACSGAPTISTPAGFTAIAGASGTSAGNTIAGRVFVQPNNPGGITSVALTSLAGVNGVATTLLEFANVYAVDGVYGTSGGAATYSNGSTTPSAASYSPLTGPDVLVGFECDVTGQAFTAQPGGSIWFAGATATSTVGATNTIIRPFWCFASPITGFGYQLKGTLAGSIANGVSLVALLASTSGALTQPAPQAYPSGAQAGAAWGALGDTRPGFGGNGS